MHAHVTFLRRPGEDDPGYDRQTSEDILQQLLRYGITTARNPAAPAADGVALRDAVASGRITGPRIFTSGWPLNGSPFDTPERIREEVNRQQDAGVDFIKIYANSTLEQTRVAIAAAAMRGLRVIGHLQTTDWANAADMGIAALTHSVSWSAQMLPEAQRTAYAARRRADGSMKARIFWLEAVDTEGAEMERLLEALVRNAVTVDPTLIAYATKFLPREPYGLAANVTLAPAPVRDTWVEDDLTADWTEEDYARMERVWPKLLRIVKRYHEAGVLLTTGTDFPNRFVVPGVSLSQEMELLAQCGIPRADILAMATRNSASALGTLSMAGTLERGKRADLVILHDNPMNDLSAATRPFMTIANGRVFAQ